MLPERLVILGYADPFQTALRALPGAFDPARVTEEQRGLYRVTGEAGSVTARASGRMLHHAADPTDMPAVGDWVAVKGRPGEGEATIHHVLPRRSSLVRKQAGNTATGQVVAANVDQVFVMTSLNQDFNPRRIERALAMVWESGAEPVLLLTKLDLVDDPDEALAAAEAVALGVTVVALSAVSGEGLGVLEPYLRPGRTAALLGSSGVGKSTLTNRLIGREVLRVQEIRGDDDKGRHTTTHRQLVELPSGGCLIDTPGLREVGLWGSSDGLGAAFADVEALAHACRFRDCRHGGEPGCAVQAALDDGTLEQDRFDSYTKLQREIAFQERRHDVRALQEERRKWRAIHKSVRALPKRRALED